VTPPRFCEASRTALAVLGLLLVAAPAPAQGVRWPGGITVDLERDVPLGSFHATHGYAELRFKIDNTSDQRHRVLVSFPSTRYSGTFDQLREVRAEVTVEPRQTARVSLLLPERPRLPSGGNGASVAVDGEKLPDSVPIMYSVGYGHAGGIPEPLVLVTRELEFGMKQLEGRSRGAVSTDHWAVTGENLFAGGNWLKFSRYDGIVLSAGQMRALDGDTRTALFRYAEAGGSLLIVGAYPDLPRTWRKAPDGTPNLTPYEAGFGQCFLGTSSLDRWGSDEWERLHKSWRQTAQAFPATRHLLHSNERLPVIDDIGIPVRGLFILILVFVIVIGPLNLWVLTRLKRRMWMLWTVPAISFLTCLLVFGYMLIAEGWRGNRRTVALTVLDESTHRATTVGWVGYYTPMTPGDGLHFSSDTELSLMRGEELRASCTVDWSRDQHLVSGWVPARVPAHFMFRKSEAARRERVVFERGNDGSASAANQLGADVKRLWYADEQGRVWSADAIPAGGRVTLRDTGRTLPQDAGPGGRKKLRDPYAADWLHSVDQLLADPDQYLAPGRYVAELEDSPFADKGLESAQPRKCKAVVLGIRGEGVREN
jgi:hypothetical protein